MAASTEATASLQFLIFDFAKNEQLSDYCAALEFCKGFYFMGKQ
jgi:hypothetical protein